MADSENYKRLMKANTEDLRNLARDSDKTIEGYSSMNKEPLARALDEAGVVPPWPAEEDGDTNGGSAADGYQQGTAYPVQPRTPDEFSKLLRNPDVPAEQQTAPRPEDLNPHLYPTRLP